MPKNRKEAAGRPQHHFGKHSEGRLGDAQQILRALGHEMRLKILKLLREEERPVSPARAGRSLGVSISRVAHHFKVLSEAGVISLVSERPNRGATEHFYAFSGDDSPIVKAVLEVL